MIVFSNNTLKTNGKATTTQKDIIMQLVNKFENGGKIYSHVKSL